MVADISSSSQCPVCKSEQVHFALSARDQTVSGEFFEIWTCNHCSLRFTRNAPPPENIGRYYQSENYISHSNTHKGLVNTLYHRVRNLTLASKFRLVQSATGLKQGDHLDIGAGTGAFVKFMSEKGWRSQGIEPDESARRNALTDHQTHLHPAEAFPSVPSASLDAITLWHVLEHVHDLHPYLQHIKKLLRPSGRLFIAVPNYTSYDGMKYRENWAAYDVPRHLYHFSPASMKYLLNANGFKLIRTEPMWFDSFYISLLSEKYAKGRAPLFNGFLTGAVSNMKAVLDKERCSSLIYVAGM
ncbi:MAG: class I SAM-dependent methyltransferase [Bacteroidota bacterium]|nr:class I SAM-dependent methyltransferase [Bacteroidota bacterium]MDP4211907.1 class I SAM-dependent methyltransferase [Bacteroidota bacterium]MDP4248504.1 class I SAM-dependent methyltransferase [Bacteroidota bacterium]